MTELSYAQRLHRLGAAQQLVLAFGDLDEDGLPDVVLAPPAANGSFQADAAVVLKYDQSGNFGPVQSNAQLDFTRASQPVVIDIADVSAEVAELLQALASPLPESPAQDPSAQIAPEVTGPTGPAPATGASINCDAMIALAKVVAAAYKINAISFEVFFKLIPVWLKVKAPPTTPIDEDFLACLLSGVQTTEGCIAIQVLTSTCDVFHLFCGVLGRGPHCYQVAAVPGGPTSCDAPVQRSVLCDKTNDTTGCCNPSFVFNTILHSDVRNQTPMPLPPFRPFKDGDTVVLGGPQFPAPPGPDIAGLLPAAMCFLNQFGNSRNSIEIEEHDSTCATNVALPTHVLEGLADQCIEDDGVSVTSSIIGSAVDPRSRFAGLNESVGPIFLGAVRDIMRQATQNTLLAINAAGMCCDEGTVHGGTVVARPGGGLDVIPDGDTFCEMRGPPGDVPPKPPGRVVQKCGDPHLLTPDRVRYDDQAVGEFDDVIDPADGLRVQSRTHPFGSSLSIAINGAVAAQLGPEGTTIAWYAGGAVLVNHHAVALSEGKTALAGVDIYKIGTVYTAVWPDNTQLVVDLTNPYVGIRLFISDERAARLTGLLGNTNAGALVLRDGSTLVGPFGFTNFYQRFVESWRLKPLNGPEQLSLLDYDLTKGESTDTFTDRSFPHFLTTRASLTKAQAESGGAACTGVPATWLDACVLDVGLTGASGFASQFLGLPDATSSIDLQPAQVQATSIPSPAGSGPLGIALGPDGNFWITESQASAIARLTPAGMTTEFPLPTRGSVPNHITAGPDGNLWFTEGSGNKIGRITPTGTINEFTIPTAGSQPLGINPGPDGNLWFCEATGNKIGRITPVGAITEFPLPNANSGPDRIVAGSDGNLWFTEQVGSRIGRITSAGLITEFAQGVTANSKPHYIAAGPDGNLWFTEATGNKIGRITPIGAVAEFPIPTASSGVDGIVAGRDGNLWFAEFSGNAIGRITPDGVMTEFRQGIGTGSGLDQIAVGPNGDLWFTELGSGAVGRITPP